MNLAELAKQIEQRDVSPVEVVNDCLKRVEQWNPTVNAVITLCEEQALEQAKQAEAEISEGRYRGPLHGIPVGLKDLVYTKGVRTTMGSHVYADFVPSKDAVVVEKIRDAGGVIIAKLNTHEFAYGPVGDKSFAGPARNPHNPAKITGGSSSGSAAAIAAEMCYAAIGTDTGGSVRIPSSACGVVGMKPTYGRVSKRGVYPLSLSLDHVGPITRTVRDNALFLNQIAGYDAEDYGSFQQAPEDFTRLLNLDLKGTVVGVPQKYFLDVLEEEVRAQFEKALQHFESLGAQIQTVVFPDIDFVTWAMPIIQQSEAYAIHEENLKMHGDKYDDEVRERLVASSAPKGYEYFNAIQGRSKATAALNAAMEGIDVMVTPTLPILPTDLLQREVDVNGSMQSVRAMLLRLTFPFNYVGQPALSVPCGKSTSGLPMGLQIAGKLYEEAIVYRFGHQFEETFGK